MSDVVVMLVDNGSTRAASVLSLRAIASRLAAACGHPVHPVSLQHADRVTPDQLDGIAAQVLPVFLRNQLSAGLRKFIVVPLIFGNSRALTSFIPEQAALLAEEFGPFELRLAEALVPLPRGEPLLARILAEQVAQCSAALGTLPTRVVVVDHGSPQPEVTAARAKVTMGLRDHLAEGIALGQAVMERRRGAEYDFNGQLLADMLDSCAAQDPHAVVILAMMFIAPGRHAGPGGDIETICRDAMQKNPGLRVGISRLVGEHPLLVDILNQRLRALL